MAALTAVTVAALALYDMLKSIDKGLSIEEVVLLEKRGGRSGHYRREDYSRRTTLRSAIQSFPASSRLSTNVARAATNPATSDRSPNATESCGSACETR